MFDDFENFFKPAGSTFFKAIFWCTFGPKIIVLVVFKI